MLDMLPSSPQSWLAPHLDKDGGGGLGRGLGELTSWNVMWANLTLDCISLHRINCNRPLKPRLAKEAESMFDVAVDLKELHEPNDCWKMFSRRCCPGLYVSEQQAWHGFKALFLFAVILGLIRARFVTKKWIPAFTFPSTEKRARVSLMAHARCFSVNSQQTAVIKQLMEAFHSFLSFFFFFPFHPTTRLLYCLYRSETFTRRSF